MSNINRRSRGFTLIELLVVVLILGILLAIAIPAYLSSVNTAKTNTANSNARAILTAVQASYVANGGTLKYDSAPMVACTGTCLSDLGGSIPTNPCSSGAGIAGYTIDVTTPTKYIITGKNENGCTTAPSTYSVGQ